MIEKMCLVTLLLILAIVQDSVGQEVLVKRAQVIDATANPDLIQISFLVSSGVEGNSNLTDPKDEASLTYSEIESIGTVSEENDVININFQSALQQNQQIAAYNVTLRGEGITDPINLTSSFTFFTSSNRTQTETSTASICLQKEINVTTREEVQQWYIAIVLIPCLILGFLLAVLIMWLIQIFCIGRSSVGKNSDIDKTGAEKIFHLQPDENNPDLPFILVCDDVTKSNRMLELCEIDDVIYSENHVQAEKTTILGLLVDAASTNSNKTSASRKENAALLKQEIKEASENAMQEKQKRQPETNEQNYQRISGLPRRHHDEIDKLKMELASTTPEVQDELLSLANERHKLERNEEEHIFRLKTRESERREKDVNDITCQIYCDKLDAILNDEENNHPSGTRDSYMFLLEQSNRIVEMESARIRNVRMTRKSEIDKIRANELKTRASWNKFGQVLIDSVKSISRELQLEPEVRKTMTSFIKEEMVKIKTVFDEEMTKEKSDYLKTCSHEKHKNYKKNTKSNVSTRGMHENPIGWMEENIKLINDNLHLRAETQKEFNEYAVDTWKKRLDIVLRSTSEKMYALKTEVILKLGQNGASKNSVEEFINKQIDEIKIEPTQETAATLLANNHTSSHSQSKARAQDIILNCHSKVLKHFVDSQIYPTEKTADEAFTHVQAAQHKKTKISLQMLREFIEHHTRAIERNNRVPKQKSNKGYLRSVKNEETIRTRLETQLDKWNNDIESLPSSTQSNASVIEFRNNMKSVEQNLSKAVSTELRNQMEKKKTLDLLNLDLNALERLMMTLLQTLVSERKLTPAECNAVLQEHKNQVSDLQKLASQRTKRRLEQVVRKRLHSPPPRSFVKDAENLSEIANFQIRHHLDVTKGVADKAKQTIKEDSIAAKGKYEISSQLCEQQATELRELNLKVIQALVKVAKISSMEMNACLTLLLHHRKSEEIRMMLQIIYSGVKDENNEKSNLLPAVRELIAQQKHRLAENILRTDEDFGPTPIRQSHKLQRIKQPHRVTFHDDTPALRRDRFSPLPDIRPEPVGRTSSPDQDSVSDYQTHPSTLYSNYSDQPLKPTRRRKKKSLKNLNLNR